MPSITPQSLGVILFCIVCLFAIKVLFTINHTSTTSRLSSSSSSSHSVSKTNASASISRLPPTLAVLEKAFGESRSQLFHDLMILCETANQRKDPCFGHHSPVFGKFLGIQRTIYSSNNNNVSIPKAEKMFATPEEWDTRCRAQVQLKDGREASVCAAAAYVALPFPLSANMVQQLDGEQKRKPSHGTTRLSTNLTLLVVTVVSNYDATDTVSRSLTFQSACLHGIALHVLGVGAGLHFPPGKKIEQLVTFFEQIPMAEQVIFDGSMVPSNHYPFPHSLTIYPLSHECTMGSPRSRPVRWCCLSMDLMYYFKLVRMRFCNDFNKQINDCCLPEIIHVFRSNIGQTMLVV